MTKKEDKEIDALETSPKVRPFVQFNFVLDASP